MPTISGTANGDELGDTLDDDVIDALGGDDIVTIRAGSDSVNGGAGTDTFVLRYGDIASDVTGGALGTAFYTGSVDRQVLFTGFEIFDILTGSGNDTIDTAGGNDVIRTGGGSDAIDAGAGNDFIDGGAGGDIMRGGAGDDIYVVDDFSDQIEEEAGQGSDEVRTALSYIVLGPNWSIETLAFTGTGNFQGNGNRFDNVITGGAGDDVLFGADGNDRLIGGAGNDTLVGGNGVDTSIGGVGDDVYQIFNANAVIVELAGEGIDEIQLSSVHTFSIAGLAHIEKLTSLSMAANHMLTGNALNNEIRTGFGNDLIDGGAGDDLMAGGRGNDIYIVDSHGDVVEELFADGNGGIDEIRTSLATFDLNAFYYVEKLTGTSNSGQTLIGNSQANVITGGAGNDVIDGMGVFNNPGADRLDGGAGDDILKSGGFGNTFIGGTGNDTFITDNRGDVIVENAGEGTDTLVLLYSDFDEGWDGYANVEIIQCGIDSIGYSSTISYNVYGDGRNNVIQGNKFADRLDGGDGNDTLIGGEGDDTLIGGAGNDLLDGGAGIDMMTGGIGNDVYVVNSTEDVVTELAGQGTDEIRTSLLTYVLSANLENLTYTGSDSANLRGNAGSNVITGGAGNDFFQLQDGGSDRVIGVGGQFTFNNYYFGDALDVTDRVIGADSSFDQVLLRGQITLVFGAGMFTSVETIALVSRADTFFGVSSESFSYTLTAHDSNLAAGKQMVVDGRALLTDERVDFDGSAEKDGSFLILGGRGDDRMIGGAGNDEFLGSLGNDVMIGGLGDDFYNIDSLGDQVTELANQGTDTIIVSLLHYTLGANFENLFGSFHGNQTLIGNGVANQIRGGGGGDTLKGLGGNDLYIVVAGDTVVEAAGQGIDRVETALAAYTLTANVEDLTGTAATGQRLIGNDLNNRIVGGAGNDNLAGGAGNDTLVGGAGRDTFDGGAGFDRLEGGDGGDVYYVDTEDTVIELEGDGAIDAVYVRASFVLAAGSHVELLATTDFRLTTRIDLTGNELNNAITGSNGVNLLRGGGGSDSLRAYDGNDTLDGGAGIDQLLGGLGNDTYYVDTGDRVTELAGEGTDTVYATASFDLTAGAEVEILAAADFRLTTRLDLGGNELANAISGNNGVNVLRGGGGADTLRGYEGNDTLDGGTGIDQLIGGLGNDIYYVDTGDRVTETAGEGIDTVYATASFVLAAGSEVEVLATSDYRLTGRLDLTGNEFNNRVTGNNGVNHLSGGGGNDNIDGLAGADQLSGGAGADRFLFTTALGGGNVDAVLDFGNGADLFLLSGGAGQPFATLADGALAASAFATGTAAADANDRIVYNQQTGQIFYDADGSGAGAAILFATVIAGTQLTAADFLVI